VGTKRVPLFNQGVVFLFWKIQIVIHKTPGYPQ
jgi:hypothetical protein